MCDKRKKRESKGPGARSSSLWRAMLFTRLHATGLASALAAFCSSNLAAALPQQAVATRTQSPPKIDGKLDDAVWQQARPIGELIQSNPLEGQPASEATEVRFLYDSEHLYISMRFFDSRPDEIITSSRERDANLDEDDRFEMILDTFHDKRSAFWFQMNAGGSKSDALLTPGSFNKPWDGIWEGRSSIDSEGWSCELSIPFKTLSFDPSKSAWGFNISRFLGRQREVSQWANPRLESRIFNIDQAGTLTGLKDINQGIGLDVIPFWVGNLSRDRTSAEGTSWLGEPGLDAFYKVTPSLTLSLTLNTDFAETEVDARRINLTRFPLFFPERRDFFLQDSGLFNFAGFRRGFTPFFSRTIGLSGGSAIPIQAGLKLTGRVDGFNLGILDVQADSGSATDAENLFVTRVSKNIGEQSLVGGIVTRGNPNSTGDATTYGVDAQFKTADFLSDKRLESTVWALRSDNQGVSDQDAAVGASLRYPNDLYSWNLGFQKIQENFNPALGFVPRKGIQSYSGGFSYQPRPNNDIRQLEFSVSSNAVYDNGGQLETWSSSILPLGISFESGDQLRFRVNHVQDALTEDFEISDGIVIDKGQYIYDRLRLEFDSARQRTLSVRLGAGTGGFFDGRRDDYSASLNYRHSALFTGSVEWSQNNVNLDAGEFQSQISRLRTRFSFTPDLSWNTFVQWDNDSKTIGINSRLRWIPTPGHEMFLVINETLNEARGAVVQEAQNLAFKISYTLRF